MCARHNTPQGVSQIEQQDIRNAALLTNGAFVGREQEMATLRASLADTLAGSGRLALLVGEAGIGKTRTAHELAAHAHRQGARVFIGRCYEGNGAPPFWPWVQIVRTYLQESDLTTLQTDMGTGAVDIAQVIPEMRARFPDLPQSPPLDSESGQFRFFDSFTSFLKNVARTQPLVLILDDLHWADTSSLLLLQFLVQGLHEVPLFIVGTYRPLVLELHHPLRQTLGTLARAPGSQTIELHGLVERDIASFMHNATGTVPDASLLTVVHQQTEGNPFFLSEVVRLLTNEGQQPPFFGSHSVNTILIPQRVYDVISRRLTQLSDTCLQVLMLASVVGREFTLEVLTQASDLPRTAILQALENAIAARIITDNRHTDGSYSFSHALIRETLYKELPLTQRIAFHCKVGEAVEKLSATDPRPLLTELAYHFAMAAQSGSGIKKAIDYTTQAGAQATAVFAYEEAGKHYQEALRLLSHHEPDEALRCELLLALGDAQRRAGQLTQTRETFLTASTIARKHEQPRQFARAALGFAGLWVAVGVVDKAVVALLEEALQILGEEDDILRARLYARLATEFWFAESREQRLTFSEQAVQLARRTADQKTLGYCLQAYHLALWGSPRLEERLATTAEILRLSEQTEDPELALHGYSRRVVDLLEAGDLSAVDSAIATHTRLAEELRRPQYLWQSLIWKGMRAVMAGQFEEGELLAQQALALGQRTQVSHEDAVLGFGIQMFTIRREQGRLLEMEAALTGFIEQYPTLTTLRCALAFLRSEGGQRVATQELFEDLAIHGFTDLPQDMTFPLALAFLAHVCAFLEDTPRAAQLYALLLPYANCNIVTSSAITYHEPADLSLGLLATVLGKQGEAQAHFSAAIAMASKLGARPRLAVAQYAYANFLLTGQRSGDREYAYTLLDAALDTAQELGMVDLEEKVKGQRTKVKSQKSKRGTEKQETEIAGNLTPRIVNLSSQAPSPQPPAPSVFHCEGEYWTITHGEVSFRLKHIRGLDYIAQLLKHPNVEFHVLDLVSRPQQPPFVPATAYELTSSELPTQAHPDGTEVLLDTKAREAYKQRLTELREELEEAQSFNDLGRIDKAQQEIGFISAELARGLGLGGRSRNAASAAERARVNVVKGIKAALAKIAEHSPLLEHYLTTTIKTGVFCSYTPPPFNPISWEL